MDAAVNTINYNERFITKVVKEISSKFNFNVIQQRVITDILYKCTQNVEILLLEKEAGDFLTYIDMYVNSMRLEGLSELTIKNKKYTLKALNEYLEKDIHKVTIADLKMYILKKQSECKNNTLNGIIVTIKTFFKFLCEEGYLENNPAYKLKKVKEEKRLKKSVNEVTFEQIRLACKNKRDRAIIEFAYATGVRVSELVNINISDLDFYSNSLKVIGKGNKERIVLFSEISKYYIKQYLDERKDTNPALFVGNKKPYNRLSQRAVQKIFSNLKKDLGLNIPLHPHILRHTFATKLAATADITVVQKLLGHSSINTTMVYAEINDDKVNYQYKASKL